MATEITVQDEITCSVCFEIYRDPHALKECLHTFCLPCIKQLKKGRRVECPQCRKYTSFKQIMKDFKTQCLIDKVQIYQETGEISTKTCGMCENPEKTVKYRCKECDWFMCEACRKGHQKIKACQSHKVTTVSGLMQEFQTKIEKNIKELENEDKLTAKQSKKITSKIEEINKSMNQQIRQVQQFTRDMMENLKENEKRLTNLIADTSKALVRTLTAKEQICNNSQQETRDKVKFLNEVIQTQDFNTLKETAESIDENIRESIKKIRASLPDVDEMSQSPVTVKRNDSWDVQDFIQVLIDEKPQSSLSSQLEKSTRPVIKQRSDPQNTLSTYPRLYGKEWNQLDSTGIEQLCQKLCEINNDIWCGGDNKITVYNKRCKRVKTITHHRLSSIRAITQCNNQVIVACHDEGLHSLTTGGQYITQVIAGCFSDVCVKGDYLYGLEYREKKVIKYSGQWEKIMEISLHHGHGNERDRLCVTQNTIYVSSWRTMQIYTYNTEGQLLHKTTNNYLILLCCVDEEDSSLVADLLKDILYVVHNNRWRPLILTGENQLEFNLPLHALLDTDGNLWFATNNYQLVKYTATSI